MTRSETMGAAAAPAWSGPRGLRQRFVSMSGWSQSMVRPVRTARSLVFHSTRVHMADTLSGGGAPGRRSGIKTACGGA